MANVRRPRVDYESRTLGLDRNELSALLVQAGLGSSRDHALISILAMNGLRISEALGADIEDLDTERGHCTLKIRAKDARRSRCRELDPCQAALASVVVG
jgi:integrase/recombinase XerD